MIDAKLEQFMGVYEKNLGAAVSGWPDEYCWPREQVPDVAGRMRNAIIRGTYNHGGRAFKMTCKELGIKHTRKAITEFLEQA
jgi:hypothetical protein